MPIIKILRVYLIFILTITGVSILGYNPSVKSYLASVIHTGYEDQNLKNSPDVGPTKNQASANILNEKVRKIRQYRDGVISLDVESDIEKSFAEPGSENVEIMKLILNSREKIVQFDSLKLKLIGADAEKINKLYITKEDGDIVTGKRNGNYFEFNLNSKIEKNSQSLLVVSADLSEDLQTNNRLRLSIESPEDIEFIVDGKKHNLLDEYPIRGPYLSIAKNRSWGKTWIAPKQ